MYECVSVCVCACTVRIKKNLSELAQEHSSCGPYKFT